MNHKLITAVVAALAMATLSGCGSSTEAKAAPGSTASATSSAPSSYLPKATAGAVVDGRELASKMLVAMLASKTVHLSQAINGAQPGQGDIEFSVPVKVAYTSGQQGQRVQIVAVGGATYMKGAPGTSAKPWFKLDPKGTDAFSKATSAVNDLSRSTDPRLMVSMMEGVQGQDMGTERVGDVSTEHYAFEIPFSGASRMLSPEVLKVMQGMLEQGTLKMPMAVDDWVGDDNLPRRLTVVMEVGAQTQTTEATFSDWGKPVTIVAPPAAQVGPRPGM